MHLRHARGRERLGVDVLELLADAGPASKLMQKKRAVIFEGTARGRPQAVQRSAVQAWCGHGTGRGSFFFCSHGMEGGGRRRKIVEIRPRENERRLRAARRDEKRGGRRKETDKWRGSKKNNPTLIGGAAPCPHELTRPATTTEPTIHRKPLSTPHAAASHPPSLPPSPAPTGLSLLTSSLMIAKILEYGTGSVASRHFWNSRTYLCRVPRSASGVFRADLEFVIREKSKLHRIAPQCAAVHRIAPQIIKIKGEAPERRGSSRRRGGGGPRRR